MIRTLLLFLLLSSSWSAESVLTGKIVSCPKWTLNRNAELKVFLREGEAEQYEGITIDWVFGKKLQGMHACKSRISMRDGHSLRLPLCFSGKKAAMHIYDDGKEIETVDLYSLKTRPEMHALMQAKGFQRKDQEEIYKDVRIRKAEKDIRSLEQVPTVYSTIRSLYAIVGVCTVAFAILIRRGSKKTRPGALPR